jgi:hypothetical protein
VKIATFFHGTEGYRQFFDRLVGDTNLAGGWLPNTSELTIINLMVKLYSEAQEKAMRGSSTLVMLYVLLKVSKSLLTFLAGIFYKMALLCTKVDALSPLGFSPVGRREQRMSTDSTSERWAFRAGALGSRLQQ